MAYTTVASTAAAQTLLAADASREVVIIDNTDANVLYILVGGGTTVVSATNYTAAIAASGTYTVPQLLAGDKITGIWAADGAGSALITYK